MPPRRKPTRNWGQAIKSTRDVAKQKLNILLWGATGVGKTHFIGTAPSVFIIATEKGTLTLHNKDIPFFQVTDDMPVFDMLMMIFQSAEKKEKVFKVDEEGEVTDELLVDFALIETIAIDSVWKLNEMLLLELCDNANRDKASFDEWGLLLTKMSKIISRLVAMDFHSIITIGQAVKKDEMEENEKVMEFNMRGSYRHQIAYEFDFNFYMATEAQGTRLSYVAYTKEENKRSAKSRVELPRKLVNPKFQTVWDAVQKELKPA